MLRKRILFTLLAIIAIGYAARGPITATLFDWYLKGYCRSCLHSRLSYEKLSRDGDNWVFINPVLATRNRLEEGGYRFQADKATVNLSLSIFSRSIVLDVNLDSPHIDVGRGADDLVAVLNRPTQTFHLFEVHTQFTVPQGTILVHNFNEEDLVPIPLSFSIDLLCRQNKKGCVSLWLGKELTEDKGFVATFTETDGKVQKANLSFNNLCCSSLQKVLQGLWPDHASVEIAKGKLNGSVEITLPEGEPSYSEGTLILQNLRLNHESSNSVVAIDEATLNLFPRFQGEGAQTAVETIGEVELSGPASLRFSKKDDPLWRFDATEGTLGFKVGEYIRFHLEGDVASLDKKRSMQVEGSGRFADAGQGSYKVDVALKGEDPLDETSFHFSSRELGDDWSFCEADLSGLGMNDIVLLQHLAFKDHPDLQQFDILKGSFDATVLVYLNGLSLSEVTVERIAAHGLEFAFGPWDLVGGVNEAAGSFSFDLAHDDPLKTFNADLSLRRGNMHLAGMENSTWQFTNVNTNLYMRQGVFRKSVLKGVIAGLRGEMVVDGAREGTNLALTFKGSAEEFSQAFPDALKKGIRKGFPQDQLTVTAKAQKNERGLHFDGKLSIADTQGSKDEVDFGFTLEQTSQNLWKRWPPHPFAGEYCPDAGLEVFDAVVPPIAEPLSAMYRQLIAQEMGIAGFTLRDGWFKGNSLPLKKFLSPFMFRNDQMALSGKGNFSGQFDMNKLSIHYDAQDMVLENEDFSIEIKQLGKGNGSDSHLAQCLVDFDRKHIYNAFEVVNATYFEKNSGLLFTEINSGFCLEDDVARFNNLTGFCNGIYIAGGIDIDWSMPGDGIFEVAMNVDQMHGKISQVQHFLTHLDSALFFLKIPLEGDASLSKEGGTLRFAFSPQGYEFQTQLRGAITDGKIEAQNADLTLQDLSIQFNYDHKANIFEFTEPQGTLLIGKGAHVEEYSLIGDGVRFTNYDKNEAVFDVRVTDNIDDFVRVAGKTVSREDEGIDFVFDHALTRFGNIRPTELELSLKDWSQVDLFTLNFEFKLSELLGDVQRFSRTGLFFISRGALSGLNRLDNAKGTFNASVGYDGARSSLNYQVEGEAIAFGKHAFDKFLLTGSKRGSLWSVEQLTLDEMSLAFDLVKEGPLWNINFLGARFGKSLLIGLEGQYNDEDSFLETRINLLEADLARLDEWPALSEWLKDTPVDGQIRAAGVLHAEFDKSLPGGIGLNVAMNGSLANGRFKEIALQDIQNASFKYSSETGFELGNVGTGIKSHGGGVLAGLFLRSATYNPSDKDILLDGLFFDIPVDNLKWIAMALQDAFPDAINAGATETISALQTKGSVQGAVRLHIGDPYTSMRLSLNDGVYTLFGQEHDISRFVVDLDPFAVKVFTEYRFNNHRMRLEAVSPLPSLDGGEIILTDLSKEGGMAPAMPLTIQWKSHPQAGFYIQKVAGSLSGLTMNLVRDPNKPLAYDRMNLIGQVDINLHKAQNLMEYDMAAKVRELEFGDGYSLSGQWSYEKGSDKKLIDCLSFQGDFSGRDFEAYGYRFYNMSSQMSFMPGACYFRSLALADSSGSLQIEQIDLIAQPDGSWHAAIPVINLNEFRPSLLRTSSAAPPHLAKSLVVRNLNIKNLVGVVGYRDTFTGTGQLTFANPPKKNLQHTILAIPAELLTRIGLDLDVLTPVRGTVLFDIGNGRADLKRFKDVYSKGKMSKFNLCNGGRNCYVDFDGNLNLNIRMKQYNLIFKLAELFTVNVRGTLQKPTYTLNKHQKRTPNEVVEAPEPYPAMMQY